MSESCELHYPLRSASENNTSGVIRLIFHVMSGFDNPARRIAQIDIFVFFKPGVAGAGVL